MCCIQSVSKFGILSSGHSARKGQFSFQSKRNAKWLSEALQIAEKSREVKGKGERERYTQWNADFQRIARRNKKVFISEQCKN